MLGCVWWMLAVAAVGFGPGHAVIEPSNTCQDQITTDVLFAAGAFHTCGATGMVPGEGQGSKDYRRSLLCWGWSDHGQLSAPDIDHVTAVAAGARHSCATDRQRLAKCWGSNVYGQAEVPQAKTPSVTIMLRIVLPMADVVRNGQLYIHAVETAIVWWRTQAGATAPSKGEKVTLDDIRPGEGIVEDDTLSSNVTETTDVTVAVAAGDLETAESLQKAMAEEGILRQLVVAGLTSARLLRGAEIVGLVSKQYCILGDSVNWPIEYVQKNGTEQIVPGTGGPFCKEKVPIFVCLHEIPRTYAWVRGGHLGREKQRARARAREKAKERKREREK